MKNKKNILFIFIIGLTIAALVLISSALNIVSLKNNYVATIANNNAILCSGVANKLQYSIKYGKSLNNYYGIEDMFDQITFFCSYVENVYVVNTEGKILYKKNYNGTSIHESYVFKENAESLPYLKESFLFWGDNGSNQNILLPIRDKSGEVIAGLGMMYNNSNLDESIYPFINQLINFIIISIILGLAIFIFLFLYIKHNFIYKKLLAFVIPVIIFSSVFCGVASFNIYKTAYTDLVNKTADMLFLRIQNDIDSVVSYGIDYSDLVGLDEYFNDMLRNADQIEDISMTALASDSVKQYKLDDSYYINITTSQDYVQNKLRDIIIDIFSAIVTSILISAEVIIFILAILINLKELRATRKSSIQKTTDEDTLPVGVVRGLFFFFAMFQYMSLAFVPIVMAGIYRPVLGLPYEIVMSIPITAQLLMSICSSAVCGSIISSRGWRPIAVFGMAFMICGALVASISKEPILFIVAQIIMGFGLGCAKTAFDIFSIIVPSSERLDEYTTSANASLIVGLSCSAAIGAVIASVVGYSGAFIAMAVFGVFVIILTFAFSTNIVHQHTNNTVENHPKFKLDHKFIVYLLLLVIPYSFISMYLDYFFPVFADTNGMSTANIGHIFLLYGIATSYVGTWLCKVISKNIKTIVTMSGLLFLLGAFMGIFSVAPQILMAVLFVIFIGIADGIMPSLQYKYVYSLDISKHLGISKVIGIEGSFVSMIRGISPMIFGLVMLYGVSGLLISSIIVMIVALLFLLLSKAKKEVG